MPVEYRINKEKTISFLENMTLLVSFIATILVIGSNDLFYALTNSYYSETVVTRREFIRADVRDELGRLSSSFLLFPGLTVHMMLDVFYLVFSVSLFIVYCYFTTPNRHNDSSNASSEFRSKLLEIHDPTYSGNRSDLSSIR